MRLLVHVSEQCAAAHITDDNLFFFFLHCNCPWPCSALRIDPKQIIEIYINVVSMHMSEQCIVAHIAYVSLFFCVVTIQGIVPYRALSLCELLRFALMWLLMQVSEQCAVAYITDDSLSILFVHRTVPHRAQAHTDY